MLISCSLSRTVVLILCQLDGAVGKRLLAHLSRPHWLPASLPHMTGFLMDTELWMKDKIVPIYEHALAGRDTASPAVARLERELFHVGERIYIVNAKESIRRNIGKLLSRGMWGR